MQVSQKTSPPKDLPKLSIIVAMTNARVIGDQCGLPWHLPEDLQLFKRITMGKTVIMGRRTYQSIGQPLQGRHNIVLSRSPEQLSGIQVCTSFEEGLISAARYGESIFIIGGTELYRKALPIAAELHISWVYENLSGDVFFPALDLSKWIVCSESEYAGFKHVVYKRKECIEHQMIYEYTSTIS